MGVVSGLIGMIPVISMPRSRTDVPVRMRWGAQVYDPDEAPEDHQPARNGNTLDDAVFSHIPKPDKRPNQPQSTSTFTMIGGQPVHHAAKKPARNR